MNDARDGEGASRSVPAEAHPERSATQRGQVLALGPDAVPTAKCSTCGELIVWVFHESGKRAPFDAVPSDVGLWELHQDGARLVAKYVGPGIKPERLLADPAVVDGYFTPHFATCIDASAHRR